MSAQEPEMSESSYYIILRDGKKSKRLSCQRVKQLAASNQLRPHDMIQADGDDEWQSVEQFLEEPGLKTNSRQTPRTGIIAVCVVAVVTVSTAVGYLAWSQSQIKQLNNERARIEALFQEASVAFDNEDYEDAVSLYHDIDSALFSLNNSSVWRDALIAQHERETARLTPILENVRAERAAEQERVRLAEDARIKSDAAAVAQRAEANARALREQQDADRRKKRIDDNPAQHFSVYVDELAIHWANRRPLYNSARLVSWDVKKSDSLVNPIVGYVTFQSGFVANYLDNRINIECQFALDDAHHWQPISVICKNVHPTYNTAFDVEWWRGHAQRKADDSIIWLTTVSPSIN